MVNIHNTHTGIDDPIPIGGNSSEGPAPSPEQVNMLSDMGFTPAQARKALCETVSFRLFVDKVYLIILSKASDVERAVEWLFNHPDETGEDAPNSEVSPPKAKELPGAKGLPAKYTLKAFISHKGPSVHSGHYVVHIKHQGFYPQTSAEYVEEGPDEGWILFNDEKVVKADKESVRELKRLAYLYIFEKA